MDQDEIEQRQARFRRACDQEKRTKAAAIAALKDAIGAKAEWWSALASVAQADGGGGSEYQAAVILTARRERGCESIVDRALEVTWLNRLGI